MISKQPTISVVVPVFNAEKYIAECLNSILSQTLRDIEVICVNDGSTDLSLEILQRFALADNRIKIIDQDNAGAGVARNRGFDQTHGEYIIFFDADDYMSNDALSLIYNDAITNGTDITAGRCQHYIERKQKFKDFERSIRSSLVDENRCFNPKDYANHALQIFIGWAWDKLYRRQFLLENRLQFPNIAHSEDTSFVLTSIVVAKKISYINNVIFTHRQHAASLESNRDKNPTCFFNALCLLHESIANTADFKLFEQSYINYCLAYSKWQIETMKSEEARVVMSNSFYKLDERFNLLNREPDYYYDNLLDDIKHLTHRSNNAIVKIATMPILTVKRYNNRAIYKLFGILPLYRIRRYSATKKRHYLLGFIPLIKTN